MADWYTNNNGIDIHIERPGDADEHWDVQLVIMAGGGPNVITFRFVESFEWNCNDRIERFESYTNSRLRRQVLIDEVIEWKCLQTAWRPCYIDIDELKFVIVSVCNALIHDKIPSSRVLFELKWILDRAVSAQSEPRYREYRNHIRRNDRTGKYELDLDYATYRKIWASAFGCGKIEKN